MYRSITNMPTWMNIADYTSAYGYGMLALIRQYCIDCIVGISDSTM